MKLNVEVKIKMDNGKEVTLKSEDARELFYELKEIFGKEREIIPVAYPTYDRPWWWPYQPRIWSNTAGTISMNCSVQK